MQVAIKQRCKKLPRNSVARNQLHTTKRMIPAGPKQSARSDLRAVSTKKEHPWT